MSRYLLTRPRVQEVEAEGRAGKVGVVVEDGSLGVDGDWGAWGLEDGFAADEERVVAGETV